MTVTVSGVHLFNVARGEAEEAELWDAITEEQLADWEGEWLPEQFKAIQRFDGTAFPGLLGRKAATGIGVGRSRVYGECWLLQASALSAME